jgi:hypothetical protein
MGGFFIGNEIKNPSGREGFYYGFLPDYFTCLLTILASSNMDT